MQSKKGWVDNMEDLLIEVLESFGYPVFLQGSLSEDAPYPDNFFTFWNNSSFSDAYYNNDENSIIYDYDVNFYSCDPSAVYTVLRDAKQRLKLSKFIVSGDGYSVASDEQTHDGRGINVRYMKY